MQNYMTSTLVKERLRALLGDDLAVYSSADFEGVVKYCLSLSQEEFESFMSGAHAVLSLQRGDVAERALSSVLDVIKKVDKAALFRYGKATQTIQSMDLSEKATKNLMRQIHDSVSHQTQEENKSLVDISGEFLAKSTKVAVIFKSISASMKKEMLKEIYSNCINRMKTFWQRVEPERFKGVVDTLSSGLGESNFTEKEIVDLSSRCATIFCDSTREKILGIEEILAEFKEYVLDLVNQMPELKAKDLEKLRDYRFGQMLRTAGSVAKTSVEQVKEVTSLLKGQNIGQIYKEEINDPNNKYSKLFTEFANAKINLTVRDMAWVMTKNPSIFGSSVIGSIETLSKIKNNMKEIYGKKADSIDFNQLLTRDNFLKGIPKHLSNEDVYRTIDLLSSFTPAGELISFLQNDMRVLEIPYDVLQQMVIESFSSAKTSEDLVENLNKTLKERIKTYKIQNQSREGDTSKIHEKEQISGYKSRVDAGVDINVDFEAGEIGDLLFDFNLPKLKMVLGPYYNSFYNRITKSKIDRAKLDDVILSSGANHAAAVHSQDKSFYSSYAVFDGDKLQSFVHDKTQKGFNTVEMLYGLQRNINSAISLIEKLDSRPDKYSLTDKIYICSTNYFKVASERDDILLSINDVGNELWGTVSHVTDLVNIAFQKLTKRYSLLMKQDMPYLEKYTASLEKQALILTRRLEEFDGDHLTAQSNILEETRKIIEENLIENHIKYANNENIMLQGREQIRKIKKLLQEERSNAGAQKTVVEPSEGENYSIIALIGYSEEEFKLEQELIKLNGTQAQIKDKLDYLSRRTYELSKQLEEIDRQIKAGSIYAGIKARLDKLNLRIAHAKKIYEMSSVDEDESNK